MKFFKLLLCACPVFLIISCQKDRVPVPTVPQAVVIDQSVDVPVPEGFENWPRTIFLFDKEKCIRKISVNNESEMPVKFDVGAGYKVLALAYDTTDNLLISPEQAGEASYRYKVCAKDFSAPLPRLWCASVPFDKEEDKLVLSFRPITSTLNIEFESVPSDLDSVTVDLPVSMDTWYPGEQKSEVSIAGAVRKHLVLTPDMMESRISMGVFSMLNCDSKDSSLLRCQVPVCFHYRDMRKPGIIPFKGRIGEAQECDIVIEDSHETYYDNDFNVRHTRRNMDGSDEVSGVQPLSLWPISRDYEVASDTTSFPMFAGRSYAFHFGSCSFEFHDDVTSFDWGDRSHFFNEYAGYGFDFFRIPVDEGWCFFSNGELKPDCKIQLKRIVDSGIAAGARIIIDLHWLATTNLFPNSQQEIRYRNCWRQLHELFKDYSPEILAYELLNEADGEDGYYNTFLANSVAMIRSWGGNEIRRKIVCGCPDYQSISGMEKLQLPQDPNLIASFHSYDPVFFCFYGTGFSPQSGFDHYTGPCHYPGYMVTKDELKYMQENEPWNYEGTLYFRNSYNDRESLYNEFKPAYEAGKRLKVPVWIGEYGAAAAAGTSKSDRLNYYRDACSLFRQFGFAHSFWFELDTDETGAPDKRVLDEILGRK